MNFARELSYHGDSLLPKGPTTSTFACAGGGMGTGMPTAMHLYFVAYVHELIRVGQLFYKEQYISLSINTCFFRQCIRKFA